MAEAFQLELILQTEQVLYKGQVEELVASDGEKSPSEKVLSHPGHGDSGS